MKNFKCTITPKRLTPTKTGSYVYVIKGPKPMLEFYMDEQGENLVMDDELNLPLFFTKKLFVFGGELKYNADYERPFVGEPNIQSALAVQAMAMNMATMALPVETPKSEDENSDDAELETPKAKPTSAKRGLGKK